MFGFCKLNSEIHGVKDYIYSLEKQMELHDGLLKECCAKIDQLSAEVVKMKKEVKKPPPKKQDIKKVKK